MRPSSQTPIRRRLAVQLRRYFITGLLIVVPAVITYIVLRLVFDSIDGVLQPLLESILERRFPGLGIVALAMLIILTGAAGTTGPGKHLVQFVQKELFRLPIVGPVYSASEHLIESFSGSSETGFKRVVAIEYPRFGTWTIGFLTGFTMDENQGHLAVVYIPTAPTPNSGWVAIVSARDVYDTNLSVQEALRLVLSGGILSPAQIRRQPLTL